MSENFRCIRIEKAKNGFTVTVEKDPEISKKGELAYASSYEKPTVHEDADSLLTYLKRCIGGGHTRAKGESAGSFAKRAALDSYDKMEKKSA